MPLCIQGISLRSSHEEQSSSLERNIKSCCNFDTSFVHEFLCGGTDPMKPYIKWQALKLYVSICFHVVAFSTKLYFHYNILIQVVNSTFLERQVDCPLLSSCCRPDIPSGFGTLSRKEGEEGGADHLEMD